MALKWSEDSTTKFVELYRDHECLWNTELHIYRNKQAREAAIRTIVNSMDMEGLDVKNKINNLRSTYIQELAKIKKSQHSGARAEEVYKPRMKWFVIMHSFLQKVYKRRKTQYTLHVKNESCDENEWQQEVHSETSSQKDDSCSEDVYQPIVKRPKITRTKLKEAPLRTKELQSPTTSVQAVEPTEDEFQIFGHSVAAQLKKLPLAQAVSAQSEIQSLLSRYRLAHINSNQVVTGNRK